MPSMGEHILPQPPVQSTHPEADSHAVLERGTKVTLYDPKGRPGREYSGVVTNVGSMVERHDVHVELSDGSM